MPGWMERVAGPRARPRPGIRLPGWVRSLARGAASLLPGRGAESRGGPAAGEDVVSRAARGGAMGRVTEGRVPGPDGARLSSLAPGDVATVEGLADPGSREGRALAGMGVLPGASVEVLQRYPAWIVRIDHAELALDDALAGQVRVRRSA